MDMLAHTRVMTTSLFCGHVDRHGRPFIDPYSDPLRLDKIGATERGASGAVARSLWAEHVDDDDWVVKQLEHIAVDPDTPLDFNQSPRSRFDDDAFEQDYLCERSNDDSVRDSGGEIVEVSVADQNA